MKKIFTLIATALIGGFSYGQSIGIIGDFNGWSSDVVMNTTDNTTYTASAVAFGITGGAKFRQDADWAVNWGADVFPSGVGVAGGGNIPVPAGTYDVTFNIMTGDYNFAPASTGFDEINIIGAFAGGATSSPMVTTDGVTYFRDNQEFYTNSAQFSVVGGSTYGGSAFPTGVATVGGPEIPLVRGYYNVGFVNTTGAYTFSEVNVGIIGSAVAPYDWSADVNMVSTDGGVTFKLDNFDLIDGVIKFRANDSWGVNWGEIVDDGAEVDTATMGASDIVVSAGTFDITFNRYTGLFCISPTACSIAEGFPAGVGINEIEMNMENNVYPNPVSDILVIKTDATDFVVEILDLTGKVVLTSKEAKINTSNLQSGSYIYKLNVNGSVSTGNIVKL